MATTGTEAVDTDAACKKLSDILKGKLAQQDEDTESMLYTVLVPKLVAAHYTTEALLGMATREGLAAAGMPHTIIDLLLKAFQPTAIGGGWKQTDSKARAEGRRLMYANIIIINDRTDPPIQCRMLALVDTGAGQELIIPGRKAQELQLVERGRANVTGFGGASVGMAKYAPVLVRLPGDDSEGHEQTFKEADLDVFAQAVPFTAQEDLCDFAGLKRSQQVSPEGNLQLTPVSSPPSGHIPAVILGMEGLRKLRVTVKPGEAVLCPVVPWEELLVL